MNYASDLESGVLIRRYKRFLADVLTRNGETLTIHCPNTGAMTHCAEPGWRVWYSTSPNAGRKYPHTWELVQNDRGELIGINTGRANTMVAEAVADGRIPELAGYREQRAEVRYGREGKSRIDLLLADSVDGRPDCYVEVKSVTLPDGAGGGLFPDAVSERARKHVEELVTVVREGRRGVLCFCVQHEGIGSVKAARAVDPIYADALIEARRAGVEMIAYRVHFAEDGSGIGAALEVEDG